MGTDTQSDEVQPPKHLYKYLDRYGLEALFNLELKITPPNEFADPFEFTPLLNKTKKEDKAAQRYFTALLNQNIPSGFSTGVMSGAHDIICREFKDAVSENGIRVLCLSREEKILSQWVAYANGHKGLVLELDTKTAPFLKPPFKGSTWNWRDVDYHTRNAADIFQAFERKRKGTADPLWSILLNAAQEKSPCWESEDEWRLIVGFSESEKQEPERIYSRLAAGKVLYFLKLQKEAISRVILGAKATPEFEREIRKAAAHSGIPADRIVRAELDHQNLSVVIPPKSNRP
jgi:hypothetical protein